MRIKGQTTRIPAEADIRFATVGERAGRWYVALTVQQAMSDPASLAPIGEPIGIDIGLRHALTLSTGEVIDSPKPLAVSLRKLRRRQRALARSEAARKRQELVLREQGRLGAKERLPRSARQQSKQRQVARLYARIANIRANWLHGVSNRLTRQYPVIGHEKLAIKNLSNKQRHNGRAWADLGAGELFRQIAYKAAWRGVTVVVADRFYPSSQLCSSCGYRKRDLTLRDRIFVCPACGLRLDRDDNAAINLRPVAVIPTETLNARGGNVSPSPRGTSVTVLWQIPRSALALPERQKREPSPEMAHLVASG